MEIGHDKIIEAIGEVSGDIKALNATMKAHMADIDRRLSANTLRVNDHAERLRAQEEFKTRHETKHRTIGVIFASALTVVGGAAAFWRDIKDIFA